MYKAVSVLSFLAVMAIGTSALASTASYTNASDKSVNIINSEQKAYKTISITNENGEIVYLNQNNDGYSEVVTFYLKENTSYGKYTVRIGGDDNFERFCFYIGLEATEGDIAMTRLGEEEVSGVWNLAYCVSVDAATYNNYRTIKVGYMDDEIIHYGGFKLKDGSYPSIYSGEGSINLVFQLNDVPYEYKDYVTVYLSGDVINDMAK